MSEEKANRETQLPPSRLGPASRVIPGVLALLGYLALFSLGLHLSSQPYRSKINLALGVTEDQGKPVAVANAAAGAQASAVTQASGMLVSGPGAPPATPAVSAAPKEEPPVIDWYALFMSSLIYTPVNVALLTLLAGFIGGCASNLAYEHSRVAAEHLGRNENGGPPEPADRVALAKGGDAASEAAFFLSESPFAAMLRSFLVYLAFIAGIFIAGNAPFKDGTADQYVRFAATVSVFAFIIGYDPTKFRQFVDTLPSRR